jgi:hypothetical protein
MTQAALFTTALAVAFAAVLALVLLSGRLSPVWRRHVERVLGGLALVVFAPLYVWGLVSMARDGDWLWIAVQPIMWAWIAVSVVRERRRRARAQMRRPGTFD